MSNGCGTDLLELLAQRILELLNLLRSPRLLDFVRVFLVGEGVLAEAENVDAATMLATTSIDGFEEFVRPIVELLGCLDGRRTVVHTSLNVQAGDVSRFCHEVHCITGVCLDPGLDAQLGDVLARAAWKLSEEVHDSGRAVDAQCVVVEHRASFFKDLLVGGEKSDSVLRSFGVHLGKDIFVGALAFECDDLVHDAVWSEVVLVDARANLFRNLEERKRLGWLEKNGFVAFEFTRGELDLLTFSMIPNCQSENVPS